MSLLRMNLAVLLTVLASTAAFSWGLLLPGMDDLRAKQHQIEMELDAVQREQTDVGDVSELYASILELNEDAILFRRRLPAERLFGEFLNSLSQCLERCGISDYNIQPRQAETLGEADLPEYFKLAAGTTVLPVTVSFHSRFDNVVEFLGCIESLDRLIHLELMDVNNSEEEPGWVQSEIVLHTFHRPED